MSAQFHLREFKMKSGAASASTVVAVGGHNHPIAASIFGHPIHVVGDMEVTAVGAALFGAQAATGWAGCLIRQQDITVIEPVAE